MIYNLSIVTGVFMATRKPKQTSDHFIKALNPRDADTKYLGEEPFFPLQPDSDQRTVALTRGFTWYNRFYGKKDAKELLCQYLDHNNRTDEAKGLRKLHESEFLMTLCWLARMNLRGLELNEHEALTLENEITRLSRALSNPEVKEVSATAGTAKVEVEPSLRPNIQEIMREKAREAAGELEGMFDDFLAGGAKPSTKFKPMDEVAKKNVLPAHISILTDIWKKKQAEFEEVQEGKDKLLNEAYSQYSKVQIKAILKFIESVINDLTSYISVKKAAKAPRARKAVPVEKQVAKLKYMKVFKDVASKLDLISVHPTKLHGASEAWVYDTAKRKLHHFIADEYSKAFTVKGNTILGLDSVQSESKTLRKPAEQIKEIMGSKPAARKFFKDIKAVASIPNGRFNENMVILKAF
jgi:hypothetical protein